MLVNHKGLCVIFTGLDRLNRPTGDTLVGCFSVQKLIAEEIRHANLTSVHVAGKVAGVLKMP